MMGRFHAYLDKVFQLGKLAARLTDSRRKPLVPTTADHRLLLQDAQGLFSQRKPDGQWTEGRRSVRRYVIASR